MIPQPSTPEVPLSDDLEIHLVHVHGSLHHCVHCDSLRAAIAAAIERAKAEERDLVLEMACLILDRQIQALGITDNQRSSTYLAQSEMHAARQQINALRTARAAEGEGTK